MSNPVTAASGQGSNRGRSTTRSNSGGEGAVKAANNNNNNNSSHVTNQNEAPTATSAGDDSRVANNASNASASAGPKDFEFVLVTDSGSRKQVRRHAMRRYVHQRRMDGIARLESTRVQVPGWVKGKAGEQASSPAPKIEELDDNGKLHAVASSSSKGNNDGTARDSKPERQQRQRQRSTFVPKTTSSGPTEPSQQLILAHFPTSTSPNLSPSSVADDPFNSFPVDLPNPSDRKLIHHFVNTYPLMMYQMGDPHHDNPIKAIFHQLALSNRVSFQAMLAIASKHSAGVGGQVDTVQSLTHKMRALRLINQELNSSACDNSDGLLYAVATMAVIEKWSKETPGERVHFQGVRHLIRRRGGMRGLRASSQFMENIMYWVDFSCGPKAIYGASLPWTGEMPDRRPTNLAFLAPQLHVPTNIGLPSETDNHQTLDFMQSCEDFLAFFRALYQLQQALLSEPPPTVQPGPPYEKSKAFEPFTPLYATLTTLPDYDHGIRDVRFIDEYTCMACLLYLNVALYDYYVTSRNFNRYLDWVSQQLRGSTSRLNSSLTSLLWIFLNNGGYAVFEAPDEGERNWVVSRMLRVIKRMEWKHAGTIWDSLRNILIRFLLTQQECEIGSDQISEVALAARKVKRQSNMAHTLWDEAEMRENILGQLYEGSPVFSAVS